ncbi:hypothetical protein [Chryseobacterium sp. ISL-6]|uniref:hypothetical protein n=1 Tax=Chryseobacterium sp. ISL-6 TaxID=2819143 RepID=UPI001BE60F6A|nr:hypothetical protein [Chryseobacterium sp. ISL-6]MBT2620256.1 hypothetical protein [Chryseobacterium sp. ISL-6]
MKKIYYVPGLISAALIPLLFWYYGNQKFEEINLNVIDIGLPVKAKSGDENNRASFESIRNWNYKKIRVLPNTAKENSKLYVSEIQNLKKRNEKETGIEFILDDHNTYGDFASLLNDMHITKNEEYALDLNKTGHFFAIHTYINPEKEECFLCGDVIAIPIDSGVENNWEAYLKYIEPKGYDKFTDILIKLPKQTFLLIFGFLILLHMSMLSFKENFQINRNPFKYVN